MAYSSNAILTKARAMYGRRLTQKNFSDLLNCSSVSDVSNYLSSNTQYKDVLSELPSGYVKRRPLENALKKHMLSQIESLAHFEKAIGQELYKYFVIRNEIDEIMSCIRLLKTPNSDEYLMKMPVFLNGLTTIDLFLLAKAQNFDDIIKSVSGTDYEKILTELHPLNETVNLPSIETALVKYLNEKTEEFAKKSLSKKEREDFIFEVRTVSDLKKISIIHRLKFIFKFEPERIENLVSFGSGTNIGSKKAKAIIFSESEKDFWENVYSTPYGHGLKQTPYKSSVEERLNRFLINRAAGKLRFSVYPSVVMFCWIILEENEINNIIHLTEGIKYKIPKDELNDQLIIPKEGDE